MVIGMKRVAAATLISSTGSGAWFTCWALFLVRSVGLASAQIGAGLAIAGTLSVLAATPLGRLADRLGPRELTVALNALAACAFASYALVGSFAAFLAVACVTECSVRGSGGVRAALVLGLAGPERRMQAMASLRVTSHVGYALGAVAGAAVLAVDARSAYVALVLGNAASFAAYAAIVARVPKVPPVPRTAPRLTVLRDRPYVTLAGLAGVLSLCWGMISTGLPLWVAGHTQAPPAVCGAIVLLGSLGVAALQVRVTQGIRSPSAAARGAILAACALAAACALIAATDGRGGALAIALLAAAALAHLGGELLFVASSWGLSIPLMPPGAAGEYSGVFTAGEAAAQTASPLIMTTLVVGLGPAGWLLLGAVFLLAASPAPAITRWALRTRPELVPE
jgi:MFS family permease